MNLVYSKNSNAKRAAEQALANRKAPEGVTSYDLVKQADGSVAIEWVLPEKPAKAKRVKSVTGVKARDTRKFTGTPADRGIQAAKADDATRDAAKADPQIQAVVAAANVVDLADAGASDAEVKRAADIASWIEQGRAGDATAARAAVEKLHRAGAAIPDELLAKVKAKSRAATGSARKESKEDEAIALLRRADGASITELMETFGWQKHTCRGFIAGAVKVKRKLAVESFKRDGVRCYRIPTGDTAGSTVAGAGDLAEATAAAQ